MNKPFKAPRVIAEQFRRYTRRNVIPLHRPSDRKDGKPVGRVPIHKNWVVRPYTSAKVIASCIEQDRNMGWRPGIEDLFLDVDPRNGGSESLLDLQLAAALDLESYPRVKTGSGGLHLFGSKPAGVRVLKKHPDFPGIDFLSCGAQVVCAGSIHPTTLEPYLFDDAFPPLEGKLPAWPDALLRLIARPEWTSSARSAGDYTGEQIAAALAVLNVDGYHKKHDEWLNLAMAVHHASSGAALDEFVAWCNQDPAYAGDENLTRHRWDTFDDNRAGGITRATLDKALAEAGHPELIVKPTAAEDFADFEGEADDDGATPAPNALIKIEQHGLSLTRFGTASDSIKNAYAAIYRSGLEPAWDELKQTSVLRTPTLPWDEKFGRVVNDHVLRIIRLHLVRAHQGVDYQPSLTNLVEAVATLAYDKKFNPVLDYIDSLKWDGTTRLDRLYSDYFNCGDDAYTRAVSNCFAVGAVRRMRHPGCKFDTMPILQSPQGWLKSSAIKTLFGAHWYSDADLGNLRDKDSAMKLRGYWVQEFAEIDSLTRAESGALKAFCSRATDRQRDPYGRIVEEAPRRCVFVATVNEGGYLKDSTGGRRFWPLQVLKPIDVDRIERDRDQIWAEAALLEFLGESDVLRQELWPVAAERQADQTSADPWGDSIRNFLEQRQRDHDRPNTDTECSTEFVPLPPHRVHTSELFDELQVKRADQTKDKAQRLRTVMECVLGWKHRRNVRVLDRNAAGYVRTLPEMHRGSLPVHSHFAL